MTGRRLSKSEKRRVVKIYAVAAVKQEWKQEAETENLSLSRYLHNLIQESRALRQQGRLKLGDRRKVEDLQQEVDQLQHRLEKQGQTDSNPHSDSKLIPRRILEGIIAEEYKNTEQISKELVRNEKFQNRLHTQLKSELYRLANHGQIEYRRGNGWKNIPEGGQR